MIRQYWTAQRPTAYTEFVVVLDVGPVSDHSSLATTHQTSNTYSILDAINSDLSSIFHNGPQSLKQPSTKKIEYHSKSTLN